MSRPETPRRAHAQGPTPETARGPGRARAPGGGGRGGLPPALQAQLTTQLRSPVNQKLTSREREIVRHVALGMRNAEVARHLFISEVTVKTHLNNIFQKLGVRDRVELTLYAIRAGIVAANEQRG